MSDFEGVLYFYGYCFVPKYGILFYQLSVYQDTLIKRHTSYIIY